jgi:hypothetical protein
MLRPSKVTRREPESATVICAGLSAFVITGVLPRALRIVRLFWLKMKMFSVQVPLTVIEFGPALLVIAFKAVVMLEYAPGPPAGQITVKSAADA